MITVSGKIILSSSHTVFLRALLYRKQLPDSNAGEVLCTLAVGTPASNESSYLLCLFLFHAPNVQKFFFGRKH
jgi:hypothetical protein